MEKLDHILIVVAEECGEVLKPEEKEEKYLFEIADLAGSIELFKEEVDYLCLESSYICSEEEFLLAVNELQYFLFKGLRFGLEDCHPETEIPNILEISYRIHIIENYIESLNIVNLEELKEKKKTKILKMLDYSKEKGRL